MSTQTITQEQSGSNARLYAGIIAALAFAALMVQPFLGEGRYGENLGGMLRFFTIWSNIGAAVIMAMIAAGRRVPPAVMAALATALAIVAVIYWALLSGIHHPQGYDRITNQFHHTIVPLATILWWLRYTPRCEPITRMVPIIMIPPLSYGVFALIHGLLTGFYAYFFLNLDEMGWPTFIVSNAVLAAFFAVTGMAMVKAKHALHSRFFVA